MKDYRHLLCIVLIALFALSVYLRNPRWPGGSLEGQPLFLIPCALITLIGFLWPTPVLPTQIGKYVGFIRRLFALGIDGWFLFSVIMVTVMPTAYICEWAATGQWQWAWDREEKFRDIIPLLVNYAWFAFAFFYYTRRVREARPTLGQFTMGFRIVPAPDGPPNYARRFRYGAFGLCLYPLTILLALRKRERKRGVFDWDAVSNTRAVSTRAP
ncbi:RDD family protein [Algimonas arctica]|uniref:RDD family protein n=1 Tax=Algimonas arctica TaxID=1479486 RepID=UPI0016780D0D